MDKENIEYEDLSCALSSGKSETSAEPVGGELWLLGVPETDVALACAGDSKEPV